MHSARTPFQTMASRYTAISRVAFNWRRTYLVSIFQMLTRKSSKRLKWITFSLGIITVTFLLTIERYQVTVELERGEQSFVCNTGNAAGKCPDVGECMLRGKWLTRPLTTAEKQKVDDYMHSARRERGAEDTLQRSDGKCFNLANEGNNWYRALCDPDGPTPCCFGNRCVNKTFNDCKCPDCHDLRHLVHAEYSTWQPKDSRCMVKNFTAEEACRLLEGATVVFVGDSLARHLYTLLLTVVAGNGHDGAIDSSATKDIYTRCSGWKILSEKICLNWIKRNVSLCNNSVRLQFYEYYRSSYWQEFLDLGISLYDKRKSLLVTGIGLHDNCDVTKVFDKFLRPLLQNRMDNGTGWPKVVWSAVHSRSEIVSNVDIEEELRKTRTFNLLMRDRMERYGVTVFDTFNMTNGVATPDGTHYGFGLNLMKAQMFLNLVQEMEDKLEW
ncbi:uncharacterized protein [Haliotis asinina]|uniref:uncharacterized protein n=1 Tax=Haliotis asinina TaxID=109174 RepID=UPI003531A52C